MVWRINYDASPPPTANGPGRFYISERRLIFQNEVSTLSNSVLSETVFNSLSLMLDAFRSLLVLEFQTRPG